MANATVTRLSATVSVSTVVSRNAGLCHSVRAPYLRSLHELFEPDPARGLVEPFLRGHDVTERLSGRRPRVRG